eukprot:6004348-Pyramimonas_sp.AAC.1
MRLLSAILPTRDSSCIGAASVARLRHVIDIAPEDGERLIPRGEMLREALPEGAAELRKCRWAAQVGHACCLGVALAHGGAR